MDPETLARAGEGDPAAQRTTTTASPRSTGRAAASIARRPARTCSKGRRTEIQFLNGFVVRERRRGWASVPTNAPHRHRPRVEMANSTPIPDTSPICG